MGRIFCIGFNKTGTVSLYTAINNLGFQGIHGMWDNHTKVFKALKEDKNLLHYFPEKITHFSDLDIIKDNFKLLDEQYPNSKFILNTRNKDSWLTSRRNHYKDYLKNKNNGKYHNGWRWIKESESDWSEEWDKHHEEVKEYFKYRPNDFLIIDIPSGDGYDKLCPFLGKEIIGKSFPRLNVTNK
jgi:hypothetical protein